jgi:MFS transporter, DHA3 family, macrolide efflux protein
MLRQRHLAILWVSQVLSAIGDNLYTIAVLWTAVRVAGGRAGIVAAAGTVSTLLFGMLGGVYADRWNRRRTMATVDLLRAATVAVLPVLAWRGTLQLWHLAAVAVVVSGLGALFDPALQASLPALVADRQMLQATNGLMDMTRRLARAIGPSLAGVLVAVLSLAHFFTLDAISFIISALAVLSLGRRFAWQPVRAQTAHGFRGIGAEIASAVRVVRAHRALAWALGSNGMSNIAWGAAFTVGAPLLADRVLAGQVGAYGLIVGAYGIGNVLGNIIIGSLTIHRRVAMLFAGRLVLGGGFFIMALSRDFARRDARRGGRGDRRADGRHRDADDDPARPPRQSDRQGLQPAPDGLQRGDGARPRARRAALCAAADPRRHRRLRAHYHHHRRGRLPAIRPD